MATLRDSLAVRLHPVLDEDLWLGPGEFRTIADEAAAMVREVRAGYPPLRPGQLKTILGAVVRVSGGSPSPGDIRASAHNGESGPFIRLHPFPMFASEIGPIAAQPDEFETAITGLLVHEFTHIKQHEGGSRTAGLLLLADKAGKTVVRTLAYDDYIAYLSTPPETAAHATQMAAEVLHLQGARLGRAAFLKACRNSPLWSHMTDHPQIRPPSKTEGHKAFMSISGLLLRNAWWAYLRLTGRPPARMIRILRALIGRRS